MSYGGILDSSMDSMEETRYKKKHSDLIMKLSRKLRFTYTEIECLILIYYKIQKSGGPKQPGMSKDQFREILHSTFDMTDDTLMDRIFLTIDKGPNVYISMEQWTTVLSLFLKGSQEEKIDYCFAVYDIVGEGMIGRDTMFNLMRTSIISPSGEEDAEESAKDLIEVLTKKMDRDRDGKISFNDYKETVVNQPMMMECLGQCLPSREAVYAFLTSFTHKVTKM